MFENEAKGWYGSYSRVGKGYAERFYIISHKDEIFSRENKKIRIKDFFNPDEIKQKSSLEQSLDVFKVYNSNGKKKTKILKSLLKQKKSFLDYSISRKKVLRKRKIKYDNIRKSLDSKYGRKENQPACTRYNPNYNYIKPKLLEGPLWKDIPGRNQKGLNANEDKIFSSQIEDNKNYKYYVLECEKSKCLVNMNKTTQRGEFGDIKDLRIRTDKPFIVPNKKRKKEIIIKTGLNKKKNNNNKNRTIGTPNIRNIALNSISDRNITNSKNTDNNISERRDLMENEKQNLSDKEKKNKTINKIILKEIGIFDNENNNNKTNNKENIEKEYYSVNKEKNKKKIRNIKSSIPKLINNNIFSYKESRNKSYLKFSNTKNQKNNNKVRAPDFDKIISREQVEKVKGYKFYMIPFITPNYSLVTERALTMTDYDKSKAKSRINRPKYKGLDYSFLYKPDKIIDKYNNHITSNVPNFDYMTSRPNKKNSPLPPFMQNVHDRFNLNNLNDKSLLLNNYSNRGYSPASTTFFPKKSYNNIVNYSVINSKKFKEDKMDDDIEKKIQILKIQVNYEPEKCEQLVREGTINKFDKITFRTNEKIIKNKRNDGFSKIIL